VFITSIVKVSVLCADQVFKSDWQAAGVGFGSLAAMAPEATVKTHDKSNTVVFIASSSLDSLPRKL
jgi:hypothetical protein